MLTVLSLVATLLIVALGFRFPRIMGWLVLTLSPVAAAFVGLTFVPAPALPLRTTQVIAAISIGILFSKNNGQLIIKFLSVSRVAQSALVFLLLMFFTALQNIDLMFFKYFFFEQVPPYLSALVIGFLVVKDERSFNSLVTIFAHSAFIISVFSIIEFFTLFNINHWLYISTSPTVDWEGMQYAGFQVDILRPVGTEGDAISTAQKLSFFLPFVVLHLSRKTFLQKIVYGWMPLAATLIGILLAQSRAVYVAVTLGLLVSMMLNKKLSNLGVQLVIGLILLFLFVPDINEIVTHTWESRFVGETFIPLSEGRDLDDRAEGSRMALSLFADSPIYGHGSWTHVFTLLEDRDAPPLPLYLAGGGLILGLPYAFLMFGLLISVFLRIRSSRNVTERLVIITIFLALGMGLFPLLFNNTDKIIYVVFLLYAAFFRVYIFNRRTHVSRVPQSDIKIAEPSAAPTGTVQ